MPEGPEVTIIAEGLENLLKGKNLLSLKILNHSKYINKSPDNYDLIIDNLPLKVEKISNKGKFIWWKFNKGFYMFNHLNMTGTWSLVENKHSSIEFDFDEDIKVFFNDVRKFGYIKFSLSGDDLDRKLSALGPDILNDKKLTFAKFRDILLKHPKKNITKVLMNQEIISGIGNYLKSEILYASKISPWRKVSELTPTELKLLFEESKKITTKSYKYGGVSRVDYKHVDGKKGTFQSKFEVYCRERTAGGAEIKKEKTPDGRTTYWVPKIQL